ncbi:LytR/AlgR family response regulator transcription factor [uncultured Hymenobacter sp.]|uniref:LytR/AlgR family response regulator transcription factor n=1 Tax=uncultured Hymenobacter sp. TaxID=170016 RepID=UPI0035C9B06A
MIRTLLVDDEPLARRRLAQLLADAPDFVISGECRNGAEALTVLQHGPPVDVVFLDVQMPDLSGVQVLQRLGNQPPPVVVFVTAYDQYTLQAFEAHAVDYLLKPLDPDRFLRCLAHVRHLLARPAVASQLPAATPAPVPTDTTDSLAEGAARLLIKQQGRYYFVETEQVQYLEARGNYVTVHAAGQQHLIRTTLSQLEQRLAPPTFLRVHRSLVVNTDFVKELRPWTRGEYVLTLHDGTHLLTSRSYTEQMQRFLQRFLL